MTAVYVVLALIFFGPIIGVFVFIADKRAKSGLKRGSSVR